MPEKCYYQKMATGKTHDAYTYLALPFVFAALWWWTGGQWLIPALVTTGVWVGGIYLSPDLDTRSRPFYRWGLFRFIWWPYQWVAKHRSALSHGIIFAPIFRLLYLSAILLLVYIALVSFVESGELTLEQLSRPRPEALSWLSRHQNDLLLFGAGVWLGSLVHILLDALSSLFKTLKL